MTEPLPTSADVAAVSAVDCAHGIPINLVCGACNAEQPNEIDATLAERGSRYGDFTKHAAVTQSIKSALFDCRHRESMPAYMVEALEMIAHKMGRIVNGDPFYHDSWHDIVGYAKLVADRLATPTDRPGLTGNWPEGE